MQFHQGLRLKQIIEEKNLVTAKIAKKLGFERRQNLSYYYTIELIKNDILIKILDAVGVDMDYFLSGNKNTELQDLKKELDIVRAENVQLLRDKINLLERISELEKTFKKGRVLV